MRDVTPADIEREFEGCGYGDFKTAVGEEVAAWLAPVRERYLELREDTAAIEGFLETRRREGARDRRAASWPTCARPMGVGPVRTPRLVFAACESPSSSWISTSSRVPSTCCSR